MVPLNMLKYILRRVTSFAIKHFIFSTSTHARIETSLLTIGFKSPMFEMILIATSLLFHRPFHTTPNPPWPIFLIRCVSFGGSYSMSNLGEFTAGSSELRQSMVLQSLVCYSAEGFVFLRHRYRHI